MTDLANRTILLGVSGGIAAYKAADLTSKLSQAGARVRVILTSHGAEFISPVTFQALSGEPVHTSTFAAPETYGMGHLALAAGAAALVVAPATANVLAKAAAGLADDLLSTTLLSVTCPVLFAPAMNPAMWAQPSTQRNVAQLAADGRHFVGPEEGWLACRERGVGRMASPEEIVWALRRLVFEPRDLDGVRVLITAGPTHEHLDPVRYLSNPSTGRQGYALAEAALLRGAQVTLVTGPSQLTPPTGAAVVAAGSRAAGRIRNPVFRHKALHLDQRIAPRKVQAALVVDLQHLDHHFVAHVHNVGDLFGPLHVEPRNMDKTLLAGGDLHKRAEIHDAGHLSVVNGARLGVVHNRVDDGHRAAAVVFVNAGNKHVPVFLDIHLHAAFRADFLDHLPARADHLADLFDGDHGGHHLRRIPGKVRARRRNPLEDHLIQDIIARLVRFVKRIPDHFGGQAADLQIHLNRGDPLARSGDLEVHIAEKVLHPLNVHHGHPAVPFGDQPAGNPRDRGLDRHARIHQRQRAAADGALGRGAVRRKHLGNKAQCIGEFLHWGNHRHFARVSQSGWENGRIGGGAARGGRRRRGRKPR